MPQGARCLALGRETRYAKKKFLVAEALADMSKSPVTVRGYVTSLPRSVDAHQASVAIVQDGVEYRILPRGAGVDLDDEVNVAVEATGLVEDVDGTLYLAVRGYKALEDAAWVDD